MSDRKGIWPAENPASAVGKGFFSDHWETGLICIERS